MKRALISVSDKSNLEQLVQFFAKQNIQMISTGGSASFIKKLGFDVISVEEVTGCSEMLLGRVKTLNHKIFAGILSPTSDHKDLLNNQIDPIDYVVVNLYPFEKTLQGQKSDDELIENIDIGGPSLLRAAAKNFKRTCVLCDSNDYQDFIEHFDQINLDKRRYYASKVFAHTTYYDSVISNYFSQDNLPASVLNFKRKQKLRYGENPHQQAVLYSSFYPSLANTQPLQGKPMSYNNYLDAQGAINVVREFSKPACSIIKHTIACGFAQADNLYDAFIRAYNSDETSAFGGIVACNQQVDEKIAKALKKHFFEVIIAPKFTADAQKVLSAKVNLRLLEFDFTTAQKYDGKFIDGGFLIQQADSMSDTPANCDENLQIAWKLVKHIKSNAIVIVKDGQLIGQCGGQTSRIDALNQSIARAHKHSTSEGGFLASDGFFPFTDSIETAHKAGIRSIIAPGGSKNDQLVIEKAKQLGVELVMMDNRHFNH